MAMTSPEVAPTPSAQLTRLSKPELIEFSRKIMTRVRELEDLVNVVARGKYIWEATFDAIYDPVMIVTSDYQIERANLAIARVAQTEITKVAGKTCYELFAGRDAPCLGCPLKNAINSGEKVENELESKVHSKDFEAHGFPYVESNGKVEKAVMYYRDITEEVRLKQEVIQQEKMAAIGMLAGGVAHEINNPLGGILAFVQLLQRKFTQKDEVYDDLKEIERAATRCKKIVQDLLDFSRVSKEKEKNLVDVNALLEKVIPFVRMEMRSLNVELKMDLAKDLPMVRIVGDRLQQVFLNLLTNGCHAMPKGGILSLVSGYDRRAKMVRIQVRDNGMGIPKEHLNRVFEPFFTTKGPGKGTGLGLSISYRIVKEHGGSITIDSEVKQGSTFTVRLPAVV